MIINSITNARVYPVFTAETPAEKKKNTNKINIHFKKDNYTSKDVGIIVASTAITAAFIGGELLSGRARSLCRLAKAEKVGLETALTEARGRISSLTETNTSINEANKSLNKEVQKLGEKLKELVEGDLSPKDVREGIYKTLKAKIDGGKLDYDVMTPPIVGKGNSKVYDDAVDFPAFSKTSNRADMQVLDIPRLAPNGGFEFTLPKSASMKVTHMPSKDFSPVFNRETAVSESYADSVRWNSDKIARDILQNFYDGHGQTLDGVRFSFTPNGRKVKVRISGDSTYTVDKAVYIGETTKRDDAKAAGNFGEGLKMCALKLLKDYDIGEFKVASDNWKLTYNLQNTSLTDKRVLSYSLEKADKYNGNYIEFETDNKSLLESMRNSINRFYHSGNEHFKCPDFENDVIGIKLLQPGEKGGIYIAGQRFEFENSYDGFKGASVFIKEKPDPRFLDVSRDRTSLDNYNLSTLGIWCTCEMPKAEQLKLLKSLQNYWSIKDYDKKLPLDYFVEGLARGFNSDKTHINFPDNCVASSPASNDVVLDLLRSGYQVCKDEFAALGMKTIRDVMGDARAHEPVMPNEIQNKKIVLLKEAIRNFSSSLEKKHFTPEELDTKIYLFDKNASKENKMYEETLAEAITDNGVSKGFWIDKSYLDSASLSHVLETALHELCHKAGGDETAAFSYKLTRVNRDAIAQILNDADIRTKIQALSKIWEDLC